MRAADTKAEDLVAFDEERPFFGKERLEVREVDHCRVDFDLAEIGIDRRVECCARADT
ncbi:hypothetical protein D3C83_104200 [compost metagenome]